jgi:glutamate transport system permease protein
MSGANVLFDVPGRRARRRHAALAVLGVAVGLVGLFLALRKLNEAGQLEKSLWTPFLTAEAWQQYLVPGLWGTFKAALLSIVLAAVFGLVFGVGRLSSVALVRWFCGVVVEFFRAVPVFIMMIFAYFGIFVRTSLVPDELAPLAAVVFALTLYNGSVIAELVRAGIHALPKGQREAGLSIGLTPSQTLRVIQLPQALTAMLPALIGQFVVIVKDSALGYGITYLELLSWSKTLGSAYANTVPAYIVCAVLFIVINYSLTVVASRVERRLSRRGRATVHEAAAVPAPVPAAATDG